MFLIRSFLFFLFLLTSRLLLVGGFSLFLRGSIGLLLLLCGLGFNFGVGTRGSLGLVVKALLSDFCCSGDGVWVKLCLFRTFSLLLGLLALIPL